MMNETCGHNRSWQMRVSTLHFGRPMGEQAHGADILTLNKKTMNNKIEMPKER